MVNAHQGWSHLDVSSVDSVLDRTVAFVWKSLSISLVVNAAKRVQKIPQTQKHDPLRNLWTEAEGVPLKTIRTTGITAQAVEFVFKYLSIILAVSSVDHVLEGP